MQDAGRREAGVYGLIHHAHIGNAKSVPDLSPNDVGLPTGRGKVIVVQENAGSCFADKELRI